MLNDYLELTEEQICMLDSFYQMHMDSTINVTAIKEKGEFYLKHYLDSLYIAKDYNFSGKTIVDIGSGGGFPAIPLAVILPESNFILIESIGKKCKFLSESADKLGLKNVTVINDRCENIHDIKADIITARGVSEVRLMLKLTASLWKDDTVMLLYKGDKLEEELKRAEKLINKRKLRYLNVRIEEPFQRTYCFVTSDSNSIDLRM